MNTPTTLKNNIHTRMPLRVKLSRAERLMADIDALIARNNFVGADLREVAKAKKALASKIKSYQRKVA